MIACEVKFSISPMPQCPNNFGSLLDYVFTTPESSSRNKQTNKQSRQNLKKNVIIYVETAMLFAKWIPKKKVNTNEEI